MELETLNKLYLELSQFVTAKTARELSLERENEALRTKCEEHRDGRLAALEKLAALEADQKR